MIIADTSAWVEFDRGTDSPIALRMRELVAQGRRGELRVTDPVIAEFAAGARDNSRELALRRVLGRLRHIRFLTPTDFDGAVTIYRRCRAAGVTPRGLIDCMIAAVALRTGATLLAQDRDITLIADVAGINLATAS